ncbi:hypothetical protein G7Z17_g3047 [Cylindrodendrum hubeiense]|uniref:Major facilitator superfamily (MFS) profile domain-containing protein n=1 Tax=Cylindrodendrum hubeiense TaxID=595255 RepID=A0A9P5LB34_9HYPO|nr:hypothetical protein G7Z17_g3047 [Cylindrodendrum hubeiense]
MAEADKQTGGHPVESHLEDAPTPHLAADVNVYPGNGKYWWQVPSLLQLNLWLLVPLITSYVSGFDGSMLNGMQSLPVWQEDFNHPSGSILGVVSTAQTIGGVVCLPLAPYLTDRFGRRFPILLGSLTIIVGSAIQSGAMNIAMFIIGRILVGTGGGLIANSAAPLIAELAHPTQRPIITAIYNTSWYLGSIVAAWVTYGTFGLTNSWSWRIPSLLQALPSILQFALIYFVPESPRWLVANGRAEDAEKILIEYHGGSDPSSTLVMWEMAEISAALETEKAQKDSSYMHFFKTAGNRHRFLICFGLGFIIQWCGNGLVSYYLVPVLNNIGITNGETQNIINGILQIFNYFTAIAAAFFVDKIGRRVLFMISTVGMALSFVIWTAISARNEQQNYENSGLGIGIVAMIFIFFFFYNIAMNPIPMAYILEVLPFTLRAKGITVFNFAQFSSSIFNGFVNPIALEAIGWRYYIVFACLIPVWAVLIWLFFPETRGKRLEEVAVLFDGDDITQGVHDKIDKMTK